MPSIFACFPVFTSFLRITFAVLQKPCQGNFGKFQESAESRFGGSEKYLYFKHILVRDYKRGKLVSYFLNNAVKTCLYGLKTSEDIEIEHFFQSKIFFHFSSNLHTSRLSAFKVVQVALYITTIQALSITLSAYQEYTARNTPFVLIIALKRCYWIAKFILKLLNCKRKYEIVLNRYITVRQLFLAGTRTLGHGFTYKRSNCSC